MEQTCSTTQTHKEISNTLTKLSYCEDIKIDKDIRFLLKQEMKEMDWDVFHTSHSLPTPLRRPLLPPSHGEFLSNESICVKWGQRWKKNHLCYPPVRRRARSQTGGGHTFSPLALSLSQKCRWRVAMTTFLNPASRCESLCRKCNGVESFGAHGESHFLAVMPILKTISGLWASKCAGCLSDD